MKMMYDDLESVCKVLEKELTRVSDKLEGTGSISPGDLEYVDKLTHAIKSVVTIKAMLESEGGGSYYDGNSRSDGVDNAAHYSNRRGRGSNARRDSMGRYASDGYSREYSRNYSGDKEMVSELRSLMEDAPDERTRQEFQKFISKIESM